ISAQRELVEQAVIERQFGGGVVAHRPNAVRREEAIHRAAVPLAVDGRPGMTDVFSRQGSELIRDDQPAVSVGLRVAGRRSESGGLHLRRVPVVVIERTILLAGDDDVLERQRDARLGRRRGADRSPGSGREERRAAEAGAPQERTSIQLRMFWYLARVAHRFTSVLYCEWRWWTMRTTRASRQRKFSIVRPTSSSALSSTSYACNRPRPYCVASLLRVKEQV